MELSHTDSIIFDLDGTLWDASAACAEAWNETFREAGNEARLDENFIRSISGLQVEKVFSEYFHFLPTEQHLHIFSRYKENERIFMGRQGGKLYPALEKVLHKLQNNYRLFIVSNCLEGYIENFLQFHKLGQFFEDFECSGNTGLPKSENLKLIVQRNSLQFPVYVGDTPWDQEAAALAGIPFIHAAYGFQQVEDAPRQLRTISELPGFFEK